MSGRPSRREFAASLLSAGVLALAPSVRAAPPIRRAAPRSAGRPSKLLVVFLAGGVDDLYSFDPKEPAEVAAGILPTFAPSQLPTLGSLRLAPPWAGLQKHMGGMQVVSGIQTSVVNHESGAINLRQMRRNVAAQQEASFAAVAGQVMAPDAVLHSIALTFFNPVVLPGAGRELTDDGGLLMAELHRVANDPSLDDAVQAALTSALRTTSRGAERESLHAIRFLLERMRGTAAPTPPPPSTRIDPGEWPGFAREVAAHKDGMELSWARYILTHGLAPSVVIAPLPGPASFDTHTYNDVLQRPFNHQLARWMQHLLDDLHATRLPDGRSLAEDVAIVMLSELGRFPYQNSYAGKDHFSQISAALLGPGLARGKFGETGREMLGAEVSLSTGRPGRGGTLVTLDDLGRTLLECIGHPDPGALGYDGRVLGFSLS